MEAELARFAAAHGYPSGEKLAGDASGRAYWRVRNGPRTAVLMDARREDDTAAFLAVAEHLRSLSLRPPRLLARHPDLPLLLLEDFGDGLAARVIERDPSQEVPIYQAAAEALAVMHSTPPPDLPAHDLPFLLEEVSRFTRFAAPEMPEEAKTEFLELWRGVLQAHALAADPVFVYRDYHAENLVWLPEAQGLNRLGLLDFQGALRGHPAYDLASLIEDARRDVSAAARDAAIDAYLAHRPNLDREPFEASLTVLAAQRHFKVLGIFARLTNEGRPGYARHVPRVDAYLRRNLKAPALRVIAKWCGRTLRVR